MKTLFWITLYFQNILDNTWLSETIKVRAMWANILWTILLHRFIYLTMQI